MSLSAVGFPVDSKKTVGKNLAAAILFPALVDFGSSTL